MRMAARHIMAAFLLVCAAAPAFSQLSEREVRTRLDAVYAGKADQVSRELPALLQQNPHDAGVLYIQAVLTTDGAAAAKRYQAIADSYPQSVWADDALYKVYQYDFSLGLYKKADEVMEQLRAKYPQSIYVTGADTKAATQENAATAGAAAVRTPALQTAAPARTETQTPVEKTAPKKIEQNAVGSAAAPAQAAPTAAGRTIAAG